MQSTTVDFSYQYASASVVQSGGMSRHCVALAPDHRGRQPFSFDSTIKNPVLFADSLMCLASIVRSNFARPVPGLLDPVVTCSPDTLRFEGFSGCCGVYVQATFDASSFGNAPTSFGTTNIDINDELRNGLARIRANEDVRLSVSPGSFEITINERPFVEKKVKLPLRWIRGFCEIQALLTRVEPIAAISGREALRFIRALPRNAARQVALWATPAGKGLRLTTRPDSCDVGIVGTDRLRILEPLVRSNDCRISIGGVPGTTISTWLCELGESRFLLALSPGIYRGFSGEGQVLEDLADETWQNVIDQVRAKLGQHGTIDAAKLATELRVSSSEIAHSLAALATRGLVGYDLHHHTYFHRVLPFQSDLVESLQPRLVAARQLIAKNGVTRHSSDNPAESQWIVQGSEVNHRVILSQDRASCTCLWYSKHQNSRGPCKHILAANLIAEGDDECQK